MCRELTYQEQYTAAGCAFPTVDVSMNWNGHQRGDFSGSGEIRI